MTPADCPLCAKLNALSALPPGEVVWTFPHSVALLGPWQYYEGYCVLVSRHHATELSQLNDPTRRAYLDELCLLAQSIEKVANPHKLNYELLGNQVPHLHWHVFPRSASDPDRLQPVWLALDRAERDELTRQRLTGTAGRTGMAVKLQKQLEQLGAPRA
jgi:diadenosine tetraphosphate (Ap4A) HIT family hydrolase